MTSLSLGRPGISHNTEYTLEAVTEVFNNNPTDKKGTRGKLRSYDVTFDSEVLCLWLNSGIYLIISGGSRVAPHSSVQPSIRFRLSVHAPRSCVVVSQDLCLLEDVFSQVGNRWKTTTTTTTVIVEMMREIVCRSTLDCGFNDDDICFC